MRRNDGLIDLSTVPSNSDTGIPKRTGPAIHWDGVGPNPDHEWQKTLAKGWVSRTAADIAGSGGWDRNGNELPDRWVKTARRQVTQARANLAAAQKAGAGAGDIAVLAGQLRERERWLRTQIDERDLVYAEVTYLVGQHEAEAKRAAYTARQAAVLDALADIKTVGDLEAAVLMDLPPGEGWEQLAKVFKDMAEV